MANITESITAMKNSRKIVTFLLVLALLGSLGYMGMYLYNTHHADKKYEELKEEVKAESESEDVSAEEVEPEPEKEPVEIPIDFKKLWKENEDIYAWITIPGTLVDYPIVQHPEDDLYYLDHTVEGVQGLPGSIYTESLNTRDFTDKNTVIYGHNMKNDTMFGSLHDFEDGTFFDEHHEMTIYTPEHILNYEIFAVLTYSDAHILFAYDFEDAAEYEAFLESVYSARGMKNHFREDVEVTAEDRIVTLSTCIGGQPNNRLLVLCVLREEL